MDLFMQLFGRFVAFVYHCFDRIVIQGYLPLLTHEEHIVHFFRDVHGIYPITTEALRTRARYTHYYFYLRDEVLGPFIVGVGPFLPFQTTYDLNEHHIIAGELPRRYWTPVATLRLFDGGTHRDVTHGNRAVRVCGRSRRQSRTPAGRVCRRGASTLCPYALAANSDSSVHAAVH